jgi:predicted AAA+ superfamily ATPase
LIEKSNKTKPINDLIHQKIITYLKKFFIIGGMPEAVAIYKETSDLLKVQNVLNDLLISIQDDFVKYKKKVTNERITEVFFAAIRQVGSKFSYSYPNVTQNSNQVRESLSLLQKAGLIIPVTHSAANGIPLGAEINPKKRKFLVFDAGIYQRALNLDISEIFIESITNIVNKWSIAELHMGLELIKNSSCYSKPELFYWQREARNSQAEVDYVIQQQENIVPIEVKAGTKGAMQSMHIFMKEKKTKNGIRCSLENFSEYENIEVIPLYAVGNIFRSQ